MQNITCFFQSWWNNPAMVGSLIPSSSFLVNAMCQQVNTDRQGYIVEIGAGTGCITKKLLEMGLNERLFVIELNDNLYNYLKDNFPTANIIHGDASQLKNLLPEYVIGNVSQIVSAIPMLNVPSDIRKEIFHSAFDVMSKDGNLIQYTYSPFKPPYLPDLEDLNVECNFVDWTLLNIPPAFIYSFEQI